MAYQIRPATTDDAEELLAIYAPYVTDSCVSFEVEVPTVDEFAARIERARAERSYIVAYDVCSGGLVGYAYNSAFRSRPAYAWASETSIYLSSTHQGRGIGSVLLDTLEELMRRQGVRMSEACITSSNAGSIAFHERHGYRRCGEHTACGYKLGQWLSVTWMEKQLLPLDNAPAASHGLTDEDMAPVLAAANARLMG